ncbi:MAG: ComEC/Rec2 family competence protein [Sphaerochaetaceae bacterium]|nr:ComEC/Rec2 family competence protein [Sphaerochaetaceae bacterium]
MNILLILLSILSVLPLLPFSVSVLWPLVPALILFSVLFYAFERKKDYAFSITLVILLSALVLHRILCICVCSSYCGPCDRDTVVFIEGFCVYDSSYSSSGALVMNVLLKKVGNCFCNTFSDFDGISLVKAISDEKAMVCAASYVRLTGHFSEDLFICDSIEVLHKGLLSHIRESLILIFEKRLSLNSLGMLLLLGRAEDLPQSITAGAAESGCLHVLALSGMHLNFLAKGVEKILGKNKISRAVGSAFVCAFVFIAGPRPSLVRAAIMYFFSFLGLKASVCAAFLLQLVFTPYVFLSRGNAFGYLSLTALIVFSEYFHWYFKGALGKRLGMLLASSSSVLLLNGPLQIILGGLWYPQAIFSGPVSSLIVLLAMALNFVILIFGPLDILLNLNALLSTSLQSLFSFSSSLGPATFAAYVIFLIVLLLFPVLCHIYERL